MAPLNFVERPSAARGALLPGLPVLPPGMERYPVAGGGTRAIELAAGDRFWILDKEGQQPAEMVFFDVQGNARAGFIGATAGGAPLRLQKALAEGGREGRAVLDALARSGFDLGRAEAVSVFAEGSAAADYQEFEAACDGLLLVGAVGERMTPDQSSPLTELVLYVRRRKRLNEKPEFVLPEPLAEPVYEYTITPGTAHAYQVKAGQYVQIIDVRGRECTDFNAFVMRDLDKGFENGIDQGATRSMNGNFFPEPGLYSKYFTTDLDPILEIVQDTSGRHDTFAVACTGRYYEDLGYFGHSNCSENISNALTPYGIRPRRGWPTINFFFNLVQENLHSFTSGEPWSRPGDFVLARAATDLLCVNSGCPDEIDPANGWNPSEIHIRVYDSAERFTKSRGYRMSSSAAVRETQETPFHARMAALGAEFTTFNGVFLPGSFRTSTLVDEWRACRERVAIMDMSALRKCEIIGPDSEEFLNGVLPRDVRKLGVGGVFYTALCNDAGGMVDDGTLMRLATLNYRWIGGADASILWLQDMARSSGLRVSVRNSSDQIANLALQGRHSADILGKLFAPVTGRPAVAELERFRFTIARHGGDNGTPVLISRTGFTGELGYELFCAPRDAEAVFDLVMAEGRSCGIAPIGMHALDVLRVEAGLPLAGAEFDGRTTPYEAGVGFTVALKSKEMAFRGREALSKAASWGKTRLVTLVFEGGEAPLPHATVRLGMTPIGRLTSISRSPALGKVIALAQVDAPHDAPATEVIVGALDGYQKQLLARTAPLCVFDPERNRVQGKYH